MTETSESAVRCPYCGSSDAEFFSLFGQQLLTVQFYCNACKTPFECVKNPHVIEVIRRAVERTG